MVNEMIVETEEEFYSDLSTIQKKGGSYILALSEERIISSAEEDSMILQSIETIEGRSERFGKLAKSVIDFKKDKIKQWFVSRVG